MNYSLSKIIDNDELILKQGPIKIIVDWQQSHQHNR